MINDGDNMLKIVSCLLQRLNTEVLYCHWKSNQHFNNALLGKDDLDILVDRKQKNTLIIILSDLGFKHFYAPESKTYVGIEDYLGFDELTGKIVHLHLHYRLVMGEKHLKGFHLPIEDKVLKSRLWNHEHQAYFSSTFYELFFLIIRTAMKIRKRDVFHRQVMNESSYLEFEWLSSNCTEFIKQLDEIDWMPKNIRILIERVYINQDYISYRKLQRLIYKELNVYAQGTKFHNTLTRSSHEFKNKLLEIGKKYFPGNTFSRRRNASGGLLISFIGADGAGKSTIIKEIYRWLYDVMDVRHVYLGSGDGNSSLPRKILKATWELLVKRRYRADPDNDTNEKKEAIDISHTKWNFKNAVWTYLLSRERIQKITRNSRYRIRGYVVLTDRYPQSEFYGLCDGKQAHEGTKRFRWAARLEQDAFAKAKLVCPDIVIKLIVSSEVAKSRKGDDINIQINQAKTERVKALNFSEQTRSYEIDADAPLNNVLLVVKRIIWQAM